MNLPVEWKDEPVKILRDRVIEQLKYNYAHDHLEDDEFEKRLDIATNTKSKKELLLTIEDLPDFKIDEDKPFKKTGVSINKSEVSESESLVHVFSGTTRKGIWNPPKKLNVVSIFGGAEFDFRKANFPPGVLKIKAINVFGGLEITVAPGINVISKGVSIFGGIDNKAGNNYDGGPTIEIDSVNVFGGIEIRVRE